MYGGLCVFLLCMCVDADQEVNFLQLLHLLQQKRATSARARKVDSLHYNGSEVVQCSESCSTQCESFERAGFETLWRFLPGVDTERKQWAKSSKKVKFVFLCQARVDKKEIFFACEIKLLGRFKKNYDSHSARQCCQRLILLEKKLQDFVFRHEFWRWLSSELFPYNDFGLFELVLEVWK